MKRYYLLILCSTYRRPEEFKRMINSFLKTKSQFTKMAVYISDDDPYLKEYKKIIKGLKKLNDFYIEVGPHKYMCEALNYFFHKFPNYQYYGDINDDQEYITDKWDMKLIEELEKNYGWGICGANDLFQSFKIHKHPTASIISGKICRLLNRYQLEGLRQFGGDMYFKHIGEGCQMLFYLDDVHIKHHHENVDDLKNGKTKDENYKFVYSVEERNHFAKIWKEYENIQKPNWIDILKIKEARENEIKARQ